MTVASMTVDRLYGLIIAKGLRNATPCV